MLLDEAGLLTRSDLLGTDCRPAAIAQAREAAFDEAALAGLPSHRLARFFDLRAPRRWEIMAAVRGRAAWKLGDLARDIEPGPWDVILWRNVAIYLRTEAVRAIARCLADTLGPGGFLVVGKAERLPDGLGLRRVARCLYERVEGSHAG
jgi:chemotaxis protein methyltransferase CheR